MIQVRCDECAGCGHECLKCQFPVSQCFCDGLDTELIGTCTECDGTGKQNKLLNGATA